jgi:hypothetical protein
VRLLANVVTYLVLDVFLWELDLLLEDAVCLLELDGLLPVIEGARNEDFVGIVFPVASGQQEAGSRNGSATYHVNV